MSLFQIKNKVEIAAILIEIEELEKTNNKLREKREEMLEKQADKYVKDLERLRQAYVLEQSAEVIDEISKDLQNSCLSTTDAVISLNRESLALTKTISKKRNEKLRLQNGRGLSHRNNPFRSHSLNVYRIGSFSFSKNNIVLNLHN
jgi:hypothetical protein